jgi:hypothetical protein
MPPIHQGQKQGREQPTISRIIRNDERMIRDLFITSDGKETILGIRQTQFDDLGGGPITKLIRLTEPEVKDLIEFWGSASGRYDFSSDREGG